MIPPIFRRLAPMSRVLGTLLIIAGLSATASAAPGDPFSTPEMDPGSVVSALTRLSGGALLLSGRRRAR